MPASHGDAAGHQDGARLLDNHGRTIQYLRLAVTDRCNLRCRYCRPPAGVRGGSVIINLPGSATGSLESLQALFPGLLHIFSMMAGEGHGPADAKEGGKG
jgi:hypothetical protein